MINLKMLKVFSLQKCNIEILIITAMNKNKINKHNSLNKKKSKKVLKNNNNSNKNCNNKTRINAYQNVSKIY